MKTLIIGEICIHKFIHFEESISTYGGIYNVYDFYKSQKDLEFLCISGDESRNIKSTNGNLTIVVDQHESSIVEFKLNNESYEGKFYISNHDFRKLQSSIDGIGLKDYVVYCPAFPGYEDICRQLIDKGNIVMLDFGFVDWIKDYSMIIKEINKYKFNHNVVLQINAGGLSEEKVESIFNLTKDKGINKVICTSFNDKIKIYWDDKIYIFTPNMIDVRFTFGAGDVFITSFLMNYSRGIDIEDNLESSNNVTINYLRRINNEIQNYYDTWATRNG